MKETGQTLFLKRDFKKVPKIIMRRKKYANNVEYKYTLNKYI